LASRRLQRRLRWVALDGSRDLTASSSPAMLSLTILPTSSTPEGLGLVQSSTPNTTTHCAQITVLRLILPPLQLVVLNQPWDDLVSVLQAGFLPENCSVVDADPEPARAVDVDPCPPLPVVASGEAGRVVSGEPFERVEVPLE
jgi:hypothetical protein